MVIPQFTLRRLMAVIALCGVFFLILSMGLRGSKLPLVLAVGTVSVLLALVMYAGMFFVVWLVSLVPIGPRPKAFQEGPSPFRAGGTMIDAAVTARAHAAASPFAASTPPLSSPAPPP